MNQTTALSKQTNQVITQARLEEFDETSIAVLAARLDQDDYPSPFDGLSDSERRATANYYYGQLQAVRELQGVLH